MDVNRALVLLSGGQDSTTCLFWALRAMGWEVEALSINYGQRHERELLAAQKVADMAGVRRHVVDLGKVLRGSSPLVNSDVSVGHYKSASELPGGVEPTFVPGRNILFLAIAANWALHLGASHIVIGVSQEDYGGYPDCRSDFIYKMEETLASGLGQHVTIHTPLLNRTKRQTVLLAQALPGCMEALAHSHTCYDGEYPPNPHNHASILRARGFNQAGVGDPLIMRAKSEGLLPPSYPDDGLVATEGS